MPDDEDYRAALIFFFNDTATTEIYTLSLHDALPIWCRRPGSCPPRRSTPPAALRPRAAPARDRKSTRLNSSHQIISYAVFCLKKKNTMTAKSSDPVRNHVDPMRSKMSKANEVSRDGR